MERKKKNNKRFLLVALLALLVAVTTVFVGTFAKYIRSGTVSDNAVVAKFGLGIPNTINLFSDSYTNVQADEEGKKIIAPGTDGEYKFEVTGTSEVAYKVSAGISIVYSDDWGGYAPLKFSIDGDNWTELEEFREDLSAALASSTMSPNSTYTSEQTIYWKWPFYTSDENDGKDTAAGFVAATGTAPSITVEIEVTAAQVD